MLVFTNQTDPVGYDNSGQQGNLVDHGYLMVEVFDQNKNPLSLAAVMIYSGEQDNIVVHRVVHTGINGKTEPICVARQNNQIFVCGILDAKLKYTIRVEYEGFYTNIHNYVQVFDDKPTTVTSIMSPLHFGAKKGSGQNHIFNNSIK